MNNKNKIALLFTLLGTILIASSFVSFANTSVYNNDQENQLNISVGESAEDFWIVDVDTGVNHSLSDFYGKVIFLDLWATWCGPCEISMPFIRELYLKYPESMLQVISIDVDEEETEAQVSAYRKSRGMDWIVGLEVNNLVSNIYGTGYIPTFVIIDPSGVIQYLKEGISDELWYDTMMPIMQGYLPDDTQKPTFTELAITNTTEISIFNPSFNLYANITDDRNVKSSYAHINAGVHTVVEKLTPIKIDGSFIINETISMLPEYLYGIDTFDVYIDAIDYFENYNISSTIVSSATPYIDAGPPVLSGYNITLTELSSTMYKVEILAEIAEDLLLTTARLEFYIDDDFIRKTLFTEYNSSHMLASINMLYSMGEPYQFTIFLVFEDVAGNLVVEETILAEPPEETTTSTTTETTTSSETSETTTTLSTETTTEAGYISIGILILFTIVFALRRTVAFRKRK